MVLESARHHLDALVPLAQQLNVASDAFTRELKTIEAELGKLNLGLEVLLYDSALDFEPFEEEIDDDEGTVRARHRRVSYLGYGRLSAGWGLLVRTFREYEFGGPNLDGPYGNAVHLRTTSLFQASRDIRMAAAEQIGGLLMHVGNETRAKLDSLKKVTDKPPSPSGIDMTLPGWEHLRYGIDEAGIVHILRNNGDTVCGARAQSTNFRTGQPCPVCVRTVRVGVNEKSHS